MIKAKKRGSVWNDAKKIDRFLCKFRAQLRGKSEKHFAMSISPLIADRLQRGKPKNTVFYEIDKMYRVTPVKCFGKKNRPDLAVNSDGIAVEYKFCGSNGLSPALGQGMIYRMQYKFVFLILILKSDSKTKQFYLDYCRNDEDLLTPLLNDLANQHRIYTYIIPSFDSLDPNFKKFKSFFC